MWFWSLALGQHVEPMVDEVLTVADVPWQADAIGNPSMVNDGNQFTMVFETRLATSDCDQAYSLGMATSTDGYTWDVRAQPITSPNAAHPCGLREPALAETRDGWFVLTVDGSTGEHHLLRRKQGRVTSRAVSGLEGLTDVSIARLEGEWFATGVDPVFGLVTAYSLDGILWGQDAPVLTYGSMWWAADEVVSPSLSCQNGAQLPWTMHLGGRSSGNTGFTYAFSSDISTWFYDLAVDVMAPEDAWDSWDAVVEGASAWVIYEREGMLSLATSDDGLPTGIASRDCDL